MNPPRVTERTARNLAWENETCHTFRKLVIFPYFGFQLDRLLVLCTPYRSWHRHSKAVYRSADLLTHLYRPTSLRPQYVQELRDAWVTF